MHPVLNDQAPLCNGLAYTHQPPTNHVLRDTLHFSSEWVTLEWKFEQVSLETLPNQPLNNLSPTTATPIAMRSCCPLPLSYFQWYAGPYLPVCFNIIAWPYLFKDNDNKLWSAFRSFYHTQLHFQSHRNASEVGFYRTGCVKCGDEECFTFYGVCRRLWKHDCVLYIVT